MMLQNSNGHSALVQITLHVGQHAVPVSPMGPDFLILKETFSARSTEGTIVLTIDDQTERIPVRLPHGIPADTRRIAIAEALPASLVAA